MRSVWNSNEQFTYNWKVKLDDHHNPRKSIGVNISHKLTRNDDINLMLTDIFFLWYGN